MGFDLPVMNRLRRTGRSPIGLFATGAQGVVYDPRDLSTMFQDVEGVTPVTTPGQPVALRLDKSKGLMLGPELVTNGSFATDADWTKGPNWTISGGTANYSGSGDYLSQSTSMVIGKTYKVTFTVSNFVSGSVTLFGAFWNVGVAATSGGTYSYTLTPTNSTLYFYGIGVLSLDNVSIRELAGNHAVQATAGARLTYGIEPKTGTRNLLIYTEDFSNGVWLTTSATVTTNVAVAPDGTTTADLIQFTGAPGASQNIFGYDTRTGAHTVSFYVKANTAGGVGQTVRIDSTGAGANAVVATLTAEWQRYSIAINPAGYFQYRVISSGGNTATELLLWGAQLESGAVATPYQKVVTAFEVTEVGVPTCHYCAYAGANSMATNSVDFTGTDKMSFFAGVKKLADAQGIICELSASWTTNTGTFSAQQTFSSPNGGYSSTSRGSAAFAGNQIANAITFNSPISNVYSSSLSIADDLNRLRIDGVLVASATGDQGTGNYGNYPLNFGRRNNTNLPFTGRDYGIVIVGKATSAAEINITEAWLAANTPTVVL